MATADAFSGKTLMITGGTGSFRQHRAQAFPRHGYRRDRIFSRDEKQDDMRHRLQERSPELAGKVRFYIGDVRDLQSVRDAMHGVDYIFHAAALKQVPSCEFFPMEAVRTNVVGTDNVLHAAIDAGVDRVVCLSTDKAAYPINAMGKSKAMMESIIYANARNGAGRTTICCTRYGNVMCSRGTVIPLFIKQIRAGEPITVTDPSMTRFLMNLDEAVDLVTFAFEHAEPGDLFVQKAPASTIGDLAEAVQEVFGRTGVRVIGTRHGEKLYETLMTREERLRAEDMGNYFRVHADTRDLNYDKFVVNGEVRRKRTRHIRATTPSGLILPARSRRLRPRSTYGLRSRVVNTRRCSSMRVLVTGAKGFVGRNLCESLKAIRDGKDRRARLAPLLPLEVYEYDLSSTEGQLEDWCSRADFVFNLAGVNRPKDSTKYMQGN